MPKDALSDGVYELFGRKAAGFDANTSTERAYLVVGAADEETAIAAVQAYAPALLGGLVQTNPNLEELCALTGTWRCSMRWGPANAPERERETHRPPLTLRPVKIGDPVRWSYRTRSIQEQIFATDPAKVTKYGPTANKREDDGAILVDDKTRQAQGCPRLFVGKDWTAEIVLAKSYVSQSFLDSIEALETTTNQNPFASSMFTIETSISWAAKSALYLGSELTEEDEAVRMHFHFYTAKNETGLTIGTISGIAKNAHDFLWTQWGPFTSGSGLIMKQAQQVYVHEIYKPTSWAPLEAVLS